MGGWENEWQKGTWQGKEERQVLSIDGHKHWERLWKKAERIDTDTKEIEVSVRWVEKPYVADLGQALERQPVWWSKGATVPAPTLFSCLFLVSNKERRVYKIQKGISTAR